MVRSIYLLYPGLHLYHGVPVVISSHPWICGRPGDEAEHPGYYYTPAGKCRG